MCQHATPQSHKCQHESISKIVMKMVKYAESAGDIFYTTGYR